MEQVGRHDSVNPSVLEAQRRQVLACSSNRVELRQTFRNDETVNEFATIALWTLLAGIAMPIGAAIASVDRIGPAWLEEEFRHFVVAFGGGALLSAVGLVLIPEGVRHLSIPSVVVCFTLGGLLFMGMDVLLNAAKRPAAQAAAMLADFIPEALALGAIFTSNPSLAPLLAVMIFLQNLPEGFNAFRELSSAAQHRPRRIIAAFFLLALLGPVFGLLGYLFLSSHEAALAGIMVFSAGGILYLVFQDIAPQAKLEKHWAPPLGAVLGFLLGLVAQMAVNAEGRKDSSSMDGSSQSRPSFQLPNHLADSLPRLGDGGWQTNYRGEFPRQS